MNIFKKIALNLRIMKPEGFKIKLRYFLNSLNKLFRFKSWKSKVLVGVFVFLVLGAGTFLVYSQSGGGGSIGGSSLNKGLIAHWGLDLEDYDTTTGQITDKTPYSNHGTNYGSMSTTDRYEKIGGAMSFNGTSDYVLINDVVTTNPTSFTIAAWIKKDGNGAVYECVLHQGSDTSIGNSSFWLGLDASDYFTATIGARTGVGWSAGILTEKPVIGEWNHLLASWDGSVVRVYLNGVFKKQYNLASYSNISTPVRLGASSNGSTYQFNGSIDDVRIYNRAFSDEEVMLLYGSYEPKIQISSINAGLVGHWTLSEEDYNSSTNKLSDKTPYENLGTNYGATFTTDRHGKVGGAMSFDGSTGKYIRINRSLNPSSWTVSSWLMKRAHTVSGYPIFWSFSLPYMASDGSGQPFRLSYSAPGQVNTSGTTIPELNQWYHVVATADSSGTKIYVNGNLEGSNSLIATNVGGAFDIGRHLGSDSYRINGAVDDLRIYNRALSANEISLLYNSYSPQSGGDTLQKGLVLDMPLTSQYTKTETAGSQIMTDKTPYGNDGQNYGATIGSEGASFNGSNNYIVLPYGQNIDPSTNPQSFSFWAKSNNPSLSTMILSTGQNPIFGNRLYIGTTGGDWEMGIAGSGWGIGSTDVTNAWTHIAVVMDGSNAKMFINGEFDHQKAYGSYTFNQNINMGRHDASYYFNGNISNLKIYDRAISTDEIKSLYTKGAADLGGIPNK